MGGAQYCSYYRPIRNNDDTLLLQNDLNKIAEWEFMWQMQFNIDKCFILRLGRPKHKLVHLYTLHNQNLSETDSAKYLGLTITSDLPDLQWNQHINNITNKANSIIGLLRRNLRIPSQTCLLITCTTTFWNMLLRYGTNDRIELYAKILNSRDSDRVARDEPYH